MSSLSSVSTSSGAGYATQVAQTSAFERSLYNLGTAVQNGDLTSAGSILTALIQANPQYAAASGASASSTASPDPLNQDFQNLANAISSNDPDTAKSAWAQLKTDLATAGVTNISSGTDLTAQAVAQNKVSMEQSLLTSLFDGGADSSSNLATLLGESGGSSSTSTDPVVAALSNWLTYQADGSASGPANSDPTADGLNTVA